MGLVQGLRSKTAGISYDRLENGNQMAPNLNSIKTSSVNNLVKNKNKFSSDNLARVHFENKVSNLHMIHYVKQEITTMNKKNLHSDAYIEMINKNKYGECEKTLNISTSKEMENSS